MTLVGLYIFVITVWPTPALEGTEMKLVQRVDNLTIAECFAMAEDLNKADIWNIGETFAVCVPYPFMEKDKGIGL